MHHTAIILAAGKGKRMQSEIPKQYLELEGKPIIYYSLKVFEESFIDNIILVTSKEDISFCRKEIVEKFGFRKVTEIVAGGSQRYHSVYQGILAAGDTDYIYIHDGARPFVTARILKDAKEQVEKYGACAAGMPVKDTIKIVDSRDFAVNTPERSLVWQVQTPQAFSGKLVKEAYEKLFSEAENDAVTDDAMVVETMLKIPVKLFQASYENIKITTPEDLQIASVFLDKNSMYKKC